ncbi:NUDIX domain-containing protein [uncultured Gilvimarinus sp.]|uniref:NUDIX domain-containing protein n=1 Tax=uncultured Gilvimarinus sp. TaxID=1689143 RepID=UPI0030D92982
MDKACPVVLRNRDGRTEILVFRHPLAGVQLAKGTVEPGETGLSAAERELWEEAGVRLKADRLLLEWQRRLGEPVWGIYLMETVSDLPNQWEHFCEDDGGHVFQFFWHSLSQEPGVQWHAVFADALRAVRKALVRAGK